LDAPAAAAAMSASSIASSESTFETTATSTGSRTMSRPGSPRASRTAFAKLVIEPESTGSSRMMTLKAASGSV
jgi:hypothetical protein